MSEKSSYLHYLPPVLWENEPPSPQLSLGRMLCIFEKILTGIDDDNIIGDSNRKYEPIETSITRLHKLFNPWTAPPEFLEWLASCVSLEFPKVENEYLWDEHQRRKITSEIVKIYQKRGLKEGLKQYLDLYAIAGKRPRIAIDDGSMILMVGPESNQLASINTLISRGAFIDKSGELLCEGIVRPQCIAIAPDGSIFVGDAGISTSPSIKAGIWHFSPCAPYKPDGLPSFPQRCGPSPWDLNNPGALVLPLALAVDSKRTWNLYVLDGVGTDAQTALYRLNSTDFTSVENIATREQLGTVHPVAMTFDINNHLLILDKGNPSVNIPPKILDVEILDGPPIQVTSTPHVLAKVKTPLSLLVRTDGFIIGDGCEQKQSTPGNLIKVDRNWQELPPLLPQLRKQNPLVAPTAIVSLDDDHLFVLDAGLKPYEPGNTSFLRTVAKPASVYSVDLSKSSSVVVPATEVGKLVYPQGMVKTEQTLYICDPGDPLSFSSSVVKWRMRPHMFGLVVHFSDQNPTNKSERKKILRNISDIANQEKPAHTLFKVVSVVE
jgi:phage tail-like protein